MKLSSPVHILKNQAKHLKREKAISMTEALDSIAEREGYSSWSLLKSKQSSVMPSSYAEVLNYFNEGDLVLIGSRPRTVYLFRQSKKKKRRITTLLYLKSIKT